jgi:glycosyltransferase involved in cell wall biosynthesis
MKELTLIIPAKNEEDSLPAVLNEIKNYKINKILVVNKLNKKIFQIAKNYKCKILEQSKPGYGNAIIEGLNKCKTKYLCIFNADGSFDPKYLPTMLKKNRKNYDLIFASRYKKNGGSKDDTIVTYFGNKIFTLIGNILFKLQLSDILFTYVMAKTDVFRKLKLRSGDFQLCVEIPIKAKINKLIIKPPAA